MKKYTLDEILNLISTKQVNMANLRDVVDSLSNYTMDEPRVQKIYLELSRTQELDEKVRIWFRNTLRQYQNNNYAMLNELNTEHNKVIEENADKIKEAEENYNNTLVIDQDSIEEKRNDSINYLIVTITAYAAAKGIKVIHDKATNQISFELTETSKPYVDNMLQKLYNSDKKINVDLERINQTQEELLTIGLNDKDLTPTQLEDSITGMLEEVDTILKDTDREVDYEEKMSPELKGLKDKFVNDDPSIPNEDFKVGYSNEDSGKSFYIVANSEVQAIKISELMGYEIKKDRGGNVFELDTDSRIMEGTKLDLASENVNDLDRMKDPWLSEIDNTKATGLNDVYVGYNASHYGDQDDYLRVMQFIEDNRTKESTAIVRIDASQTQNQRIITCYDENGIQEQLIVRNGENFDQFVLPQIINKFAAGSTFDASTRRVTEHPDGTADYQAVSNSDTYLYINNYDSQTIYNGVDPQLASMQPSDELSNSQNSIGPSGYSKKLGEMPTRNTQSNLDTDAKISFLSLLTIIIAGLFGICIFLTIYFTL